jgi:ketosteroid isomerase-like protein
MRRLLAALMFTTVTPSLAREPADELRAIEQAQDEAVNAKDIDRALQSFADDVLILGPNEQIVGKPAYAGHLEPIRNAHEIMVARVPERIVVARSGDLATIVGTYRNRFSPAPGQQSVARSGRYVTIYRRDGTGAWKVSVDMTAPDDAPVSGPR